MHKPLKRTLNLADRNTTSTTNSTDNTLNHLKHVSSQSGKVNHAPLQSAQNRILCCIINGWTLRARDKLCRCTHMWKSRKCIRMFGRITCPEALHCLLMYITGRSRSLEASSWIKAKVTATQYVWYLWLWGFGCVWQWYASCHFLLLMPVILTPWICCGYIRLYKLQHDSVWLDSDDLDIWLNLPHSKL